MHAHQGSPTGGRWIPTFAADIEVGDKIRRDGAVRHVTGRTWPPVYDPTLVLSYEDGKETVGKSSVVAIWDADGSVSARVVSRSADAAVLAAGSGSQGIAGGFVEPTP